MKTSAPGKLMLLGEHAVVYGYPCIVTAISQRLSVSDSPTEYAGDTRFIDAAVKLWGDAKTKLSATCAFSGCYGFGSSSAVTVATLKALRPDAPNKEIFDTAYKIVLDIQSAGSGFDVAAATYGGTLYYIKNKSIEPLVIKDMPLIVGYTGIKSNTVDLVSMVADKRKKYPEKVERIFQGIAKLVDEAKQKMLEGDWERVGRLMDFNQEYLRDLGVSSEKLETLIKAAKSAGAYGAKLSGAGGGDCMIALAPADKRQAVEEAITKAGGEIVQVTPNAEGVRVEP
jgi:mevalonate kinase